ncbi:PaaI family thioesterase [Modestobacter marinus]|uniref:PaaI family thioesterase n=1 Tax=Modestobacter marinus TaxID=477641 RepID=UPI001C966C2E|nr:PaaI family thioesterase [Modestobacter marinus]
MTHTRPDWLPADTQGPLDDKLGIRITEWDPERVVATMPVSGNEQPFGLLHGGATCALAESIGSWAAMLHAGPGGSVVGIELNASYLRAATSGDVTAVCTPVRRGRTLATYLIEVSDDAGRPTASARLTCLIRPARKH